MIKWKKYKISIETHMSPCFNNGQFLATFTTSKVPVWFCLFLGHTRWCPRITPGGLRGSSWVPGIEPRLSHARQVHFLLSLQPPCLWFFFFYSKSRTSKLVPGSCLGCVRPRVQFSAPQVHNCSMTSSCVSKNVKIEMLGWSIVSVTFLQTGLIFGGKIWKCSWDTVWNHFFSDLIGVAPLSSGSSCFCGHMVLFWFPDSFLALEDFFFSFRISPYNDMPSGAFFLFIAMDMFFWFEKLS